MATRRQSSTTSLAKYARANSPDLNSRSFDFCNSFWGEGDGGVDVLFARMRGAMRTMEELRGFWKERAIIEEDYAKRLSKLAKQQLGKDEIGELRNSLDTLRLETDKQASSHLELAQQVRAELENPVSAFMTKQISYKKTYQAAIEKAYKAKQTQESYVNKAREKYESDCLRINSYTAQSSLVQGKDLEKLQLKLERAKQTVTANERDFANFSRALQDTVNKWEKDWKGFCDGCQDLEEERIEFMKDNMWSYANAVSTVCVSDDESCEKIRLALEQFEPDRDMENFVRDYGTGNRIANPPQFISYTVPESSQPPNPSARYASFARSSQRPYSIAVAMRPGPPEEEPVSAGSAGIGAGGGNKSQPDAVRTDTRSRPSSQIDGGVNGVASKQYSPSAEATAPARSRTTSPQRMSQIPQQVAPTDFRNPEPQSSSIQTMLKIGDNAYPVEADKDPQSAGKAGPSTAVNAIAPAVNNHVGDGSDPLVQKMDELRKGSSNVRRNSANAGRTSRADSRRGAVSPASVASHAASGSRPANGISPPTAAEKDLYRKSAEVVVGEYPVPASRPVTPTASSAPITASFMQPPSVQQASAIPVEDVLRSYHQSFPDERRKSISRSASPGVNQIPNGNRDSAYERPVSREGHAGIGAHGRTSPHPSVAEPNGHLQTPSGRSSIVSPGITGQPSRGGTSQRVTSPVGIALDEQGRVLHDSMAETYLQQQQHQQQRQQLQQQQQQQQQHIPQIQTQPPHRRLSYGQPPNVPQQHYAVPPPQALYQPPPPPPIQQPYIPTHQVQQQPYSSYYGNQVPAPYQAAQPAYQVTQHQPVQQAYQPHINGSTGLHRGPSVNTVYYNPGPGMSSITQRHPHAASYSSYQEPVPVRSPSPAPIQRNNPPPTGQYTEDGRPVLFYVKALYDYQATIDEEFDFQAGDVIAVTSTPDDGWWTGSLLDDTRRVPGRTIFPSNFVCLF